ncbi:bactofilin family protein [Halonatronum saccharophilum]|uniref:bactofilin family protein n=1 Tax=Halonatronum saccharophilum TaxID=150060 RepID=UPI000485F0C1|nr:polymer-forming cytoskeletal protein [Halonatronum saccharophilum]
MFGKKKKKKNAKNVGTIISNSTKIEGVIKVEESIRIDGELEGELITKGDVYIGREGKLKANVTGSNVMIAGSVEGDVKADEKLEIVESGKLIGDICISNLIIHDGATFKGSSRSKMNSNNIEDKMKETKREDKSEKNNGKKKV